MKRIKILFLSLLFGLYAFQLSAQVTPNPKVNWKSTQTIFINKVEITKDFTIFYLQYYDKDAIDSFDRFLEDNPNLARQMENMGISKEKARQMFMERFGGGQFISFQPGSKIVLNNGKTYNFIKAENIPISPDRKTVIPGEKYFFRAYFEKIPPGFEMVDLIENSMDTDGSTQYWNFKGIHLNNPLNAQPADESPFEEPKIEVKNFRLYGRVLNSVTNEPIPAKIVCIDKNSGMQFDSLQTSRSGKYEFLLDRDELSYEVKAEGYTNLDESLNLSFFLKSGSFEKDIFLDPVESSEEAEKIEDTSIGEQIDESGTSFKLDKVYFDLGKAVILNESYNQLDNLAKYLKEHPGLKILIEGHTDNQGDEKLNQKLSEERAFNVRQYLINKGIDSRRIRFKGYGSSKPVSPNDTEENRSKNRRVEYSFVD